MKKVILAVIFMSIVTMFYSCKDDNPADPGPVGGDGYFPNANGNYYKYSVTTDSSGVQEQGTRSSTYSGTQRVDNQDWQIQIDSLIKGSNVNVTTSYFRKTGTGVFYFLDTTGLAASIPDTSLQRYVTADTEIRTMLFPLNDGTNWPVFKINILSFVPLEVSGSFAGRESVTLNLTSGQQTMDAVKIRYVLNIKFELTAPTRSYEAFCWVVDGIGIVKWEGNATILNGIAGNNINLDDTTKIAAQSLIEYKIN